jgi:hypothetical protein
MTMWPALLALTLSIPQAQTPAPARRLGGITVESPTYFTDGEVRGARASRLLAVGQPVELSVTAGHTLCESRSAEPTLVADAGYGWKVTLTLLSVANNGSQKIHAVWHIAWDRGRPVDGPEHSADLPLQPGGTALLDYLRRGDSPDDVQCGALGMGLQIVMPPQNPEGRPLIEAELWLVRGLPGAPEETQHQVVRFRGDSPGEYFFDEITVLGTSDKAQRARVSGRLLFLALVDDKISVELTVRESLGEPLMGGGSSTRKLTLQPGEVSAFDLPTPGRPRTAGTDPAGTLSLRIRVKRIW